jgi:hypothetical protein
MAHSRHVELAAAPAFAEYFPSKQFTHAAVDAPPEAVVYFPLGHCVQVFAMDVEEYVPARQVVHTAGINTVQAVLTYEPAAHVAHVWQTSIPVPVA